MKKNERNCEQKPIIGILGWEAEDNVALHGSLGQPDTFDFPVVYEHVKGACYETIIACPNKKTLASMVDTARKMEKEGIKAITTSCGFNAIFQNQLANAVKIPVFASTLILVPLVYNMLNNSQIVGIITADKNHLTREHMEKSGIGSSIPVCVHGLECTRSFKSWCIETKSASVNFDEFRSEVVGVARTLVDTNRNVGAIVLESTILHAFKKDIMKAINLPVFDIVSLTNFIYHSIAPKGQ